MTLSPTDNRIIVKQDESEERTTGGLIIPEQAQEKPYQGTVVAAGPGITVESGEVIPTGFEVGEKVLYNKYGGTEVTYNNEDFIILVAHDILAKII